MLVVGILCAQIICDVSLDFIFFLLFYFFSRLSLLVFLKIPSNKSVLRLFLNFRQNGVIWRFSTMSITSPLNLKKKVEKVVKNTFSVFCAVDRLFSFSCHPRSFAKIYFFSLFSLFYFSSFGSWYPSFHISVYRGCFTAFYKKPSNGVIFTEFNFNVKW